MRIKADWLHHLHALRREEIQEIFSKCPEGHFGTGLELGAGDGHQSGLLTRYVSRLVCSDLNFLRLGREQNGRIQPLICDAEWVGGCFKERKFDLVFSSNLLEHLPDPERALHGMHRVLKDNGLAIHVVPSPFLKTCHLFLHNPNRVISGLERRVAGWSGSEDRGGKPANYADRLDNNLKLPVRTPTSRWMPVPHGVSRTHRDEFRAFRKKTWLRRFNRSGFEVVAIHRGVVCSGYGFGLERTRRLLRQAGLTSAYTYVAVKQGMSSPHFRYFL